MPKSRNSALKNSIRRDEIVEIDQQILSLQRRAEIKRVGQRGAKATPTSQTLTEEFFEGLHIV